MSETRVRPSIGQLRDELARGRRRLVAHAARVRALAAETRTRGRTLADTLRALQTNGKHLHTVPKPEAPAPRPGSPGLAPMRLTPRQREVLQLLAEGHSNKEVGTMLGITTKTAETHRACIMAVLNLHSMSELVRYAIRNGIIEA